MTTDNTLPIAIVGYAIRFPGGSDTPERLWDLLIEGRDAFRDMPLDRLPPRYRHQRPDVAGKSAALRAACLDGIDRFDAGFFGISPREARLVDPQQRLLLEVAVEALERGGFPLGTVAGRRVAVFAGAPSLAYLPHIADEDFNSFCATGNDNAIVANRLSYMFDLKGPSVALHTACSTALTAFHLACQSLRSGESEMALVAAANLVTDPRFHLALSKAMVLSPTGRSRPFDAHADGYVRGEGVACFILKPLAQAEADGDFVQGVVLGSGANSDGRTAGMSLPNGDAQATLLREIYDRAGIDPACVAYVEAHGTGTAAGDPVECGAIGRVIGAAHSAQQPLLIGSIKSNIGHMEMAAGLGGLAKALLVLQHGVVPPSLHVDEPNPAIDFSGLNLAIAREATTLPRQDTPAIAGVSSFGFGGANAHVLLQAYDNGTPAPQPDPSPLILPVTARAAAAVDEVAGALADWLDAHPEATLRDVMHTQLRRRDLHRHRAIVVAKDRAALVAGLRAIESAAPSPGGALIERGIAGEPGKLAFVFTGNGPQWFAMGRGLLVDSPSFAAAFDAIDTRFRARAGFSLRDELARDEADTRMDETEVAQPCLFALQIALTAHLATLGIRPDAVMGHSVGEVAAAHVAGALDLDAAVHVIHERSRLQGLTAGRGRMAAIGLSAEQAADWLGEAASLVAVAAANGPASATLAGDSAALATLEARAKRDRIFFRFLRLNYAFHSPSMDEIHAPLQAALDGLAPHATTIPYISTVTGTELEGTALDADYWWRNIRAPVQFHRGVEALAAHGCRGFIEIGPHPALASYVSETLAETHPDAPIFETLRRREPELAATHRLLARCLAAGIGIDAQALVAAGRVVDLPTYRWQRERHWTRDPIAETPLDHPLLGSRLRPGLTQWENAISLRSHEFLAGHRFNGEAVFPAAGYFTMAAAAGLILFHGEPVDLVDVDLHKMMIVPEERPLKLLLDVQPDGHFAVRSRPSDDPEMPWTLHASGYLRPAAEASGAIAMPSPAESDDVTAGEDFYGRVSAWGFEYRDDFRLIETLRLTEDGVLVATRPSSSPSSAAGFLPAQLDAGLQSIILVLDQRKLVGSGQLFLPSGAKSVRLLQPDAPLGRVVARFSPHSTTSFDFDFLAVDGSLMARILGYQIRSAGHGLEGNGVPQHAYRWVLAQGRAELPALDLASLAAKRRAAPPSSAEVWADGSAARLLDRLCAALAAKILAELGEEADDIDADDAPLLPRLIAMAAGVDAGTAETAWRETFTQVPGIAIEAELLWQVADALPDLLRGIGDAEELLFDGPIAARLAQTIEAGSLGRPSADALCRVLCDIVASWPSDRKLSVLHIGARRSAVTSQLLAMLPKARTRLVVTDADSRIFDQLKSRADPALDLTTLTADPRVLGDLARLGGPFDLVIGNDWLQETTDLDATVSALRALLAPNGVIALDVGHGSRFAELMFGAQRGIWEMDDRGRRGELPWIRAEAWPSLLTQAGFTDVAMISGAAGESGPLRSAIVARNPHGASPVLTSLADTQSRRFLLLDSGKDDGLSAALADDLAQHGHVVERGTAATARSDGAFDDIVLVTAIGDPSQPPSAADSLALVRLIRERRDTTTMPRLTIVTQSLYGSPEDRAPLDPSPSLVWGLARSVSMEFHEFGCRRIDVAGGLEARAQLLDALFVDGIDEQRVTLHARYEHLLETVTAAVPLRNDATDAALAVRATGSLHGLGWRGFTPSPPAAGQVSVRVRATGLNFKDLLLVLGVLPPELMKHGPVGATIGLECAGEVTAIGTGVTDLAVGDRVVLSAGGALATTLTLDAGLVVKLPAWLGFADAATLSTVFTTAWYALVQIGQLQRGETLLVHGGAGGVGLAAIQIAHHLGATVFATAGTPEKRAMLRRLGVAACFDSRSLAFADAIREHTDGAGVDMALNSLAGDAMRATLGTLKPFGRFIEIGKRDLVENSPLPMRALVDNISYHAIDLDQLATLKPQAMATLMRTIVDRASAGILRPLPRLTYPASLTIDAFREMQAARHVGKLVVTYDTPLDAAPAQAPAGSLSFAGTHLITGGTKGFGLALGRWLVEHGARALVLVGRSGRLDPDSETEIASLRALGVRIEIEQVDLARGEDVVRLFAGIAASDLPPLHGIFHAAVTYHDRTIPVMQAEDFAAVIGPKAEGAWHLDRLSRDLPIEHFVMFSSIAATLGASGQSAYSAANCYLDALVDARRRHGLPGLSVNWGGISDAGFLARDTVIRKRFIDLLQVELLKVSDGFACMEQAMSVGAAHIGVGDLPWVEMERGHRASPTRRLNKILERHASRTAHRGEFLDGADWREATSPAEQRQRFGAFVLSLVAETLGYDVKAIDKSRTLGDIGADSLLALQLVVQLERQFGIHFPDVGLVQESSIDGLIDLVFARVQKADAPETETAG